MGILKFNMMLKKLGGKTCVRERTTTTITDTYYQTGTTTTAQKNVFVAIVPAKAYSIHSNIMMSTQITGNEAFGLIEIYAAYDEDIQINDVIIDGGYKYQIFDKQPYNGEYMIWEAKEIKKV